MGGTETSSRRRSWGALRHQGWIKTTTATPQEIKEIIDRAAKEPGINDVLALMQLSKEATEIQQTMANLTPQPWVMQVTGTAG
jgi:hypothetical protein